MAQISQPSAAEIPERRYANIFDLPVKGDAQKRPVGHSPNAIGGAYGIGWYEYFKDTSTGETYKVFCSDGVNGGKGSHSDDDYSRCNKYYRAVVERTHAEVAAGATEVRISRRERAVMQGFTHSKWLEVTPGKGDGQQSNDGIDVGLVGHCRGVPVVCDPTREDSLPL